MTKRREFIQISILSSIASLIGCDIKSGSYNITIGNSGSFDSTEKTILELQEAMKSERITARSLTDQYLSRINDIDKNGPKLNSVIEINPDARAIADAMDAERKNKGPRSLMHGIPVLIKDNIDTYDKMSTTAGSLALEGSIAKQDAFIVKKLRDAGAVIIGKTNLSEWANIRSSRSASGWSGRGGLTRNPYILDRNPCGSSSGSGVAVSANLCSVAVGTETDGSIVCPSSANGIVGIKPTLGLVSRSGIIPIAHSQDTAGPMTRTVTDAAILLGILTGIDSLDAVTQNSKDEIVPDYTKFLDLNGLKGARIGVARNYFKFNSDVDNLMNNAIEDMKRAGAIIIDPIDLPSPKEYEATEFEVLMYEFKNDLNKYLSQLDPKVSSRTLKQVIEFNEKNRNREMPHFGQELFLKAEAKGPLTDSDYIKALEKNHRLSRSKGIDAVITKDKLDAIVAPTGGPAWTTDLVNGDHFSGSSSTPAAVAGYPNINVPAGFVQGLPVGISFFSTAFTEPVLIKIAYAFEQTTKHRKPPKFIPTLTQ